VPLEEELNVPRLVEDINAHGIPADAYPDVDGLLDRVSGGAKSGDVILVMSNGAFGGFITKLVERLKSRT